MVDSSIDIQILDQALSIDQCYDYVIHKSCGGICLFVGTVRNHNKGEDVKYLEFESYKSMAIKEIHKICLIAKEQFHTQSIAVHHRLGHVEITEKAVIIAVSTVHRKNAFQACEFIIDKLKKTVPIWKREFLENGSYWVNATP